MPVNPVVPGTAKIAVEQTLATYNIVNTLYVDVGGSITSAEATTVASLLSGSWSTYLVPHLSTAWHLARFTITDLNVFGGAQFILPSSLVGTLTDNPLPPQIAAVVSWRTDRTGRNFRGRSYLGGFTEAGSQGAELEVALFGAIDDWADDVMAGLNTVGAMSVVSRYERNPSPPPSSIPRVTNVVTPIASRSTRSQWKTQRRREIASA